MEHEISLYIPTGVKAQNELFNGFGRRELLQSAVGSCWEGRWQPFCGWCPET